MNPYTTRTRARIEPRDMTRTLFTDPFIAATSLAVLERTRACQAEAEVARMLKEHGVMPTSAASCVVMVRQAIGANLVRAGERLARPAARGSSLETAPVSSMLRTAD